jgi:hypothetical protein
MEGCKRSSRVHTDQFWFGGPMTVGAYRDVDSEWDLHFLSAIEGEATRGRSASHHLQVRAALGMLYQTLGSTNPFAECLAPKFAPEKIELRYHTASQLGQLLHGFANRIASSIAEEYHGHIRDFWDLRTRYCSPNRGFLGLRGAPATRKSCRRRAGGR